MSTTEESPAPDAPPAPPPFAAREAETATTRVRAVGELDIATVPDLDRSLRHAETRARLIVLDLGQLEFIDASGVQLLLATSRRLQRAGRRLILTRGSAEVQWFLALTGVDRQLEIIDVPQGAPLPRSWVEGAA